MTEVINAFILSAGRGERLRPVTDHIPKPLLPILGRPVIERVLERVSALPVDRCGINLHHKKEAVEEWLSGTVFSKRVVLFPEENLLGTGGALKNACPFLGKGSFLVHNADIVSDMELGRLLEAHLLSGNIATVAVHDRPGLNSVMLDEAGRLAGVRGHSLPPSGADRLLAYTGISCYNPQFLQFLPGGVSSLVDGWLTALSAGYRIGTLDVTGSSWHDIGTPSGYVSAVLDALKSAGETVYIDSSSEGCSDAELNGYVVLEKGVILERKTSLINCIFLPGGYGEAGREYVKCIVGPGFRVDLSDSFLPAPDKDTGGVPLSAGGSDRRYFRVKKDKGYAVLLQCKDNDPDFSRHIVLTGFFRGEHVPVPDLLRVMPDESAALFEDLGDLSLYSWLKCSRGEARVRGMYRKVVDTLVLIHSIGHEDLSRFPPLRGRTFGYDDLRWETGYFMERYIRDLRKLRVESAAELETEFHHLATRVCTFPKTVMHRDFQSQNIMISAEEAVRVIDYQGARMGPPAYDLVSILWDPYSPLRQGQRKELMDYYISKMKEQGDGFFDEALFRKTVLPCRLQRHMQALGAYGFLSLVKKKNYFLKYIPEAVRLLKEDAELSADEYPILNNLVRSL
jgi:NDP-sugar pyrophosphorylase family protein